MLRRAKKRSVATELTKNDGISSQGIPETAPKTAKQADGETRPSERRRELPVLGSRIPKPDFERQLEDVVLGGQDSIVNKLQVEDREIGVLDREQRKPAWQDEGEDVIQSSTAKKDKDEALVPNNSGTKFSRSRKVEFEKVVGSTPAWAQLKSKRTNSESEDESGSDDEDEEDRLLRRTGDYLTSSEALPKSYLNFRRVTDANKEQYTKSRLHAMEFHPTSQVILTAGEDESLHIFQVDGKNNPKIQSVAVEKFPILSAHFSADGTEVIMSSRSRWYYVYDMIAGKMERVSFLREYSERQPLCKFAVSPDGQFIAFQGLYGFIHLLSAKNKELISTLKMNGLVKSIAFSGDGSKLLSFGDDGEVYVWDMKTRDCVHKFVDEGCIQGSTISVSRDGQYIACGSHSGVLNIYDNHCLTEVRPKPVRAVMNLTTQITASKFNHNSEIVATASFHTANSVKLIHLPDCHVFPNFPNHADTIGLATELDFSPNGGYMAVGNNKGKAMLYRLGHYKNY
ncbi:U3 small nucleolar RNA-associated protein 18 homolog [Asterias rubens]|uniref:U3 small nucleolar RNA-associated protein 18 homolog n=1 Tax=Asterias rubens TaxID=7604 RepID=UPI001455B891|nr:U3 small nucleolar RNA-associated protein 18 homolog [Asterias rubens]